MTIIVTLKSADDRDGFIADLASVGIEARGMDSLRRHVLAECALDAFPFSDRPEIISAEDDERIEAHQSGQISETLSAFNWGIARVVNRSAPWIDARDGRIPLPYNVSFECVRDGTGVDIYVVDTGFVTTHDEITGRATNVYDYYGGSEADNYHGTACASLAAGETVGIARGASLWSFRGFDASNTGTTTTILAAMNEALSHYNGRSGTNRPAVVNMSFAGTGSGLNSAAADMMAAGMVVVASPGNDIADMDSTTITPAEAADVICVGGCGMADTPYYLGLLASTMQGTNYGSEVDILAPAQDVLLAYTPSGDSGYARGEGTSFACPLAVGAVACMLQGYDRLSGLSDVQAVRAQLLANATTGEYVSQAHHGFGALPDRILYIDPEVSSETIAGL